MEAYRSHENQRGFTKGTKHPSTSQQWINHPLRSSPSQPESSLIKIAQTNTEIIHNTTVAAEESEPVENNTTLRLAESSVILSNENQLEYVSPKFGMRQ